MAGTGASPTSRAREDVGAVAQLLRGTAYGAGDELEGFVVGEAADPGHPRPSFCRDRSWRKGATRAPCALPKR